MPEPKRVRAIVADLAGLAGPEAMSGGEPADDEPVVLFVGIAGLATILVIEPKDTTAKLDRNHLRPTGAVWVAYVEDDLTPYQTSVDVQFYRESRVKFDQFEPLSAQLSAAAVTESIYPQGKAIAVRPSVRVGIKRIPFTLPMPMQVAFTRQGGLYGFRQWQKSLRVRRGWADVSVAAFVPASEVILNTHALTPTDFPVDGQPDFNIIVQESRRRQVFAALRLGWPGVHAATEDAPTTPEALKTAWIPDLVLGIGLPPTRATAAYVGLSWPVPRVPRLHLTAGASVLWQSRLKEVPCGIDTTDLLSVGCKVDLGWTRRNIVQGSTPVGEFVFGVIVDLFTWP